MSAAAVNANYPRVILPRAAGTPDSSRRGVILDDENVHTPRLAPRYNENTTVNIEGGYPEVAPFSKPTPTQQSR